MNIKSTSVRIIISLINVKLIKIYLPLEIDIAGICE